MKKKMDLKKLKIYMLHHNKSFISYLNTHGFIKQYGSIYKEKMGNKYVSGIVYFFSKKSPKPYWEKYLKELGKPKSRNIKFAENQDERAVIFLRVLLKNSAGANYRVTFALTFGGAHHLLKDEFIVKDFARRVSRLTLNPEKVTAIDSVTIDNNTFHTKKNSPKKLPSNKLLIRGELSLVKKIHGRSKLQNILKNKDPKSDLILGGEDGLEISGRFNLRKELVELLSYLGEEYYSNKNEEFEINELLQPVRDHDTLNKLEKELEKKLEKIVCQSVPIDYRKLRGLDIQIPYRISYENLTNVFITGLWYKDTLSSQETELNLLSFFERLRGLHITKKKFNTGPEIVNKLKSCFIELKTSANNTEEKITEKVTSVFKALIMDISIQSVRYLLFNGQWYEVNYQFYEKLKAEIDTLSNMQIPNLGPIKYPPYKNRAEDLYNKDLSSTNNILLMDKKDFRFNLDEVKNNLLNTRSSLEICDVLRFNDKDIEFIHVKRKSSASGTSHLVAQAISSATAFNELQSEMINHINLKSPKNSPDLVWENQNKHITLVILNEKFNSKTPASSLLTILEILTIMQGIHTLKELGYKVYLKMVG